MSLPKPIAELVDAAKQSIAQTHTINLIAQARSAEVHVGTIRSYVAATPELDAAFDAALTQIRAFGEMGGDPYRLQRRGRDWTEQARQLAVLAIERLEDALQDAKPSALACALGVDWR